MQDLFRSRNVHMNKKLKQLLNMKARFTIADSIPIEEISSDGIICAAKNLYSKTYQLHDVNFGIAGDDERYSIIRRWTLMLKALNPTYGLQLFIYNHSVDVDYLSDSVLLSDNTSDQSEIRNELNRIIRRNIVVGNNGIKRDIYLTLTVPAKNMNKASVLLSSAEHEILAPLRTISGCKVMPLNSAKRLNLIRDIFHGCQESELSAYNEANRQKSYVYSLENLYRSGVTAKELVEPQSMSFKSDYFILGDKVGRGFDLGRLPSTVSDVMLKDLTTMPFNFLFVINIHQLETKYAMSLVKTNRTAAAGVMADAMKKASQAGYDAALVNPEFATRFNDADRLLEELESEDQQLFDTQFHMVIFADDVKELKMNCDVFNTKCRTKDIEFKVPYGLQENVLISSMPFGYDTTPKIRTLNTRVLSLLLPFSSQEMTQKGGTAYGINKVTHNIITFNRMMGDAFNMLILGFTGSGKSFFAKKEMLSTYLNARNNADVIVIDPQAEYGSICKAVGGQEIIIRGAGNHHINPFDISEAYGLDNPNAIHRDDSRTTISEKTEFIYSMFSQIIGEAPDPAQKTAIATAAQNAYSRWARSRADDDIPTLEDFYNELIDYYNNTEDPSGSIHNLLKALEFYLVDYTTLFRGKTNVDMSSSFMSFNIADLGESNRPLAMLVILDSILNRISRNRKLNRPTFVYIDEIHLLFKQQLTAQWIHKLWKTARKYRCAPCGITQDCEDILTSEVGRAVLTNTSFVVLLKQASINAKVLAEQLQLSVRQLDFVTDTPPGEGLLYIQNSSNFTGGVIPFEDHIPADTRLYQICQTNRSYDE